MHNNTFYQTLFDADSKTVFSLDCRSTKPQPVSDCPNLPYFIINSVSNGRQDTDVNCYRNFLIEFDTLTRQAQEDTLVTVPYTTLVWSGGKSIHAILSLERPCANKAEFDALATRIKAKLPYMDKSATNAARFSRCPGYMRDGTNEQTLLEVRSRVSAAAIETWLGPAPAKKVYAQLCTTDKQKYRIKAPRTNAYLEFGESVFPEGRNKALFEISCDLYRCGYDYEQVLSIIDPICTLPDREKHVTIRSAAKTIHKA